MTLFIILSYLLALVTIIIGYIVIKKKNKTMNIKNAGISLSIVLLAIIVAGTLFSSLSGIFSLENFLLITSRITLIVTIAFLVLLIAISISDD